MDTQQQLRKELLDYLQGRHAHALLADAIKDFPMARVNDAPNGVPYSFWGLLEHIRISQNDIVDFIQNPNYKNLDWPKGYWPGAGKTTDKKTWDKTVKSFQKNFQILVKIIKNPKTDLLAKIPHGDGQTVFREAMLVIDHNAYHIGEFILMRRAMGEWKK